MREHHVGTVMVHAYGSEVEKGVYCSSWMGSVYTKRKGTYSTATLYTDGKLGEQLSWTCLILFDGWTRHTKDRSRVMRIINIVGAARQRVTG